MSGLPFFWQSNSFSMNGHSFVSYRGYEVSFTQLPSNKSQPSLFEILPCTWHRKGTANNTATMVAKEPIGEEQEKEREMRLVQLTMCVTVYITNGSEENQGWLSFHSDWSVWITRKFQNGKKLWVGNRQEINGSKIWVGRNSDSLLYGVNKKGRGRISILPFWVGAQLQS